jgi:hypothetical protein
MRRQVDPKKKDANGVITDDTDALRSLLLSEMQTRFGDGKKQLPGARAAQVCTYMDDELEAWKQAPPELMMHAQFWAAQLNGVEARFKKLARVARAVLGVPNTNAECERDFSLAKLLLAAQRKSMSAETFSRNMFLAKNRAL